MRRMKQLRKRGLAMLMALILCLSLLPANALAGEFAQEHEHNENGWTCVWTDPVTETDCTHEHDESCYTTQKLLICGEDHEHTEDCYITEEVLDCQHVCGEECVKVVTEGCWTCTPPETGDEDEAASAMDEETPAEVEEEINETPAGVQIFLAAVAQLPDSIESASDYDAVQAAMQDILPVYQAMSADDQNRDDVTKAQMKLVALQEQLGLGRPETIGTNGTVYSDSIFGFGSVICYDPRNLSEFPKTDGTQISVIPWDFYNPMHARDYYYYHDYRIGSARTEPVPDPVQSDGSYFEQTYNWIGLATFAPLTFTKNAAPGSTASLHWTQGVTNFNTYWTEIPSVYLYRVEEVIGAEYIEGGLDGITFAADDQVQLESSGGPAYDNTCPHIRVDVPIKDDAPEGVAIEVRFRLAMGYDLEWNPTSSSQARWKNTYRWYVQDFIQSVTVSGSTTNTPSADVTKYHDLYIPAGGYSAEMSFVEYYYNNWGGSTCCILSGNSYQQGDSSVASITDSVLSANPGQRKNIYNDVTITSAKNAAVGDTTELYVTYTATNPNNQRDSWTCLDVITVHIIEPREVQVDVGGQKTVSKLGTSGNSGNGTLSTNGTVFQFNEGSTSIVKGTNNPTTQTMTLTGVSAGTAVIERQYHYYLNTNGDDYLSTYVDVVRVTVGSPETGDPDSIDGLDITKTADKMNVVGGEEITYSITVTNDSSVAKTVTVTDPLPNGVTFKSFSPNNSTAKLESDGYTVTWSPTVPAKGSAVLEITCTVDNNARGYLTNVARMETADGSRDESTVQPIATPKPVTTTPSLESLTKERLTALPNGVTLPAGVEVNYDSTVVFLGDNPDPITLLYKITVKGTAGAAYKVTDEGAEWVAGGDSHTKEGSTLVITGVIPANAAEAVIYVTKTFTKDNVTDGRLTNEAKLAVDPGSGNGTTGPESGKETGSGSSDASKKYTVTINFKTDEDETLQSPIENEYEEGGSFEFGITGKAAQTFSIAPRASADVSAISIPYTIEKGGVTYVLDEVASRAALDKLTNAKDNVTADVAADLIYSRDMSGNGPNGTDTSDGIPDKYQVKVTYQVSPDGSGTIVSAGGTITGKTIYAAIKDTDGNYALKGSIHVEGTAVPADGSYTFTNWNAAMGTASVTLSGTVTANLNAEIAVERTGKETVIPAYIVTANFTKNYGTVQVNQIYDGTDHYHDVPVGADGRYDASSLVPAVIDANGVNYVRVSLTSNPENAELSGTADGNIVFTAAYEKDELVDPKVEGCENEKGDGIPDKYQVEVTFIVTGGTWKDGTTETKRVITLRNPDTQELSTSGSYVLAEEDIPALGGPDKENGFADHGWWRVSGKIETPVGYQLNHGSGFTVRYHYLPAIIATVTIDDRTVVCNGQEQTGYGQTITATLKLAGGYTADISDTHTKLSVGRAPAQAPNAGDVLTVTYTPAKGTEVGKYTNQSYIVKVMRGDRDVTELYNITVTGGGLEIVSGNGVIASDNAFIYDGVEHTIDTPDAVREGSTLTYSADGGNSWVNELPTFTDAGTYEIIIKAEHSQYPTVTKTVTVTINPAALTVTTDSASKVYDGTALTAPGRISGLVSGETVTFAVTGTQTAAGSSENGYTLTWNGTAKQSNYTVDERLGTLTVTEAAPQTVTVTWTDGLTGDVIQEQEIPVGGEIPAAPEAPEHDGWIFAGWVQTVNPDGSIINTAVYRRPTITWVNGYDGSVIATGTVNQDGTYPANPAAPTRPGYTFAGWTNPAPDANGDLTIAATWTAVLPVTPPTGGGTTIRPTPTPTTSTPAENGTDIADEDVPLASAVGLNNVEHFAYILGYDDGTVRPLENITRAEVATIFFRLMPDEYRAANWAVTNSFSDVNAGDWYNNAVSTCAKAGLLKGYGDGTFRPNEKITRAEFAAIAARFLDDEITGSQVGDFADTASHWAAAEIRRAAEAGWITGEGGLFNPERSITRAEVMTIVNRMLDRIPDAEHMLETMKKWSDNPEDAWYYEAVQEATNEHAYERDEVNTETWTEILTARDWAALESEWAAANAQ